MLPRYGVALFVLWRRRAQGEGETKGREAGLGQVRGRLRRDHFVWSKMGRTKGA